MKKIFSILLVFCLMLITACSSNTNGGTESANKEDLSDITIGIVGYMNTGPDYEAIEAFYEKVSKATGIKFKYVIGDSFDESKNVTAVQNLISSGANGIIMTMDSGMQSIMQEAESANVYVAGYMTGMEQSMSKIKDNKYFLGTVNDGVADGSVIGNKAAELVIKNNNKNVGVITFPKIYFPNQEQADKAFRAKIDEYNKTAGTQDQITVNDTVELSFQPLEDNYFKENNNIDSIFSLAAGFVYPTMVSANVENITLYSTGYDNTESYMKAFEEGTLGLQSVSNIEAMIYPIALIANAIKNEQFADKPKASEAVDTSIVFLTNMEDEKAFEENTIFSSADGAKSLLSDDEIISLIKVTNADASYENLVKTIQSWSIEELKAK